MVGSVIILSGHGYQPFYNYTQRYKSGISVNMKYQSNCVLFKDISHYGNLLRNINHI